MNQFSTISALFDHLISTDEFQSLLEKHDYVEVSRKFSARDLIDFLMAASLERWDGFRDGADRMMSLQLNAVHYSTISKKAAEVPYELAKDLFHLLAGRCNRAQRRSAPIKNALLLVDSTTITVGKNRLPWAPYHGERSGIKLHVSYTPKTDMPLQVKETEGLVHDGPAGITLANPDFILVQDRAYGKHKQLDAHQANGQRFVIRLKENVEFHRPYSLQRFSIEPSNITGDITCRLGTKQSRTENRFRVVSFTDREGHLMHVSTNVVDLSAEEIAGMYQTRWKIESFFQWIKGQLNVPVLFGKSQNAVFSQLFVALITYILIKWTFEKVKKKASKRLSQKGFVRLFLCAALPIDWRSALSEWLYDLRFEAYSIYLNFG